MPRIDRYLLSQLLTLFGFFALVLISVYWINRAMLLFEQLLGDGQTALVVLEFTILTLPLVVSVVLPVAAFAAAAYGANRMSAESEMVALRAAGLSPWRLARPVAVFGVAVAVMVAILVNALVPMARARLADRQAELAQDITARFLRPGEFQYPGRGLTLFIRDIAADGRLLDLFMDDARDPARQTTYTARETLVVRGQNGPILVMLDGMTQTLRRSEGAVPTLAVTRFEEFSYDLGALVGGGSDRGRDLRDYGTAELLRADPAVLAATGATPDLARVTAHERLAQPLMAPVAALLGFATLLIGGYSRFGVWRQVLLATLGLIFVQLLGNVVANAAGRDPAQWWLLYLPALIGASLCLAILWLAGRPFRRVEGLGAP